VKKLLIALGAVILLLVVAALVAPFLIPTETYTSRLIAAVKGATGRNLKIGGPVRLSFLPRLELDASNVSFANVPGAHDPDMARLKELDVTLRILPLLSGRIEISRFVLTEPQISLEIDKNGKPNWVFAPAGTTAPAARTPAGAPAQPVPSAYVPGLSLGDVRLVNGMVTYRDDRTGSVETVSAIDATLSLPDIDSAFKGQGSAVWNKKKLALDIGVAKPRALLTGGESPLQIKLSGDPLSLALDGNMTGLPPEKLTGTIDLSVPSVRGLAEWAGSPLPQGPGFQKLAIQGKLDMAGQKYAFSNASIAFDAITAKGAIAVALGGPRPHLTGELAADTLDMNPYLPPETPAGAAPSQGGGGGGASGAAGGAAAQGAWSDAPIDLAPLKLADVDFDLKANAIRYRKIDVGQSALELHLKNGKLVTDLKQLSLYKGQGKGIVTLDGGAATPALSLDFALKGVDMGPLLVAAAGTDKISGTGDVNFTVAGSGKSQRALVSALNGRGAFDVTNGELKGVNLIAMAQGAASRITGGTGGGANTTSFGDLTGTFTITNGILKNDDLKLKSGVVPVTGAGTVSLPEKSVNYRVVVSLAGALNVPILVTGPWDDLSYRPDLTGVLEGLTKTPGAALEKLAPLGKGAGGAAGAAGSFLKNLLPGK
jgi:AsmA protein